MATFKGFYVKMSDFRRFALASVDFSGTLCAFPWHILTGFEVYFTLSTPYMDLGLIQGVSPWPLGGPRKPWILTHFGPFLVNFGPILDCKVVISGNSAFLYLGMSIRCGLLPGFTSISLLRSEKFDFIPQISPQIPHFGEFFKFLCEGSGFHRIYFFASRAIN